MARSDREVQALTGDRHAWVGLPIGIETYEERRLLLKKAEPENVTQLKAKSPYNASVVNWDKFDAVSREEKQKRKAQVARNKQRYARASGSRSRSASGSGSGTESGGQDGDDSDEEAEDELENDNNEESPRKRGAKYRPMNEKKLVKKLEKYGYDPATMDPFEARGLARLGTFSYDIHTGRRIRHKGNNRWVGANDSSFEVQYDLPPQAAVALEEAGSDSEGGEKENLVAELGEGSLTSVRPKVFYHRSGAVTVSNPSLLNQKSRFLREHRSMFLDNYTHHNLSEYSGLLSSTYFDLTLHAQGLQRRQDPHTDSTAAMDDDITEFNYIQSPVPLAKVNTGFSQSFMTESAAGLEKSKSESRLYPTSNVFMGISGDAGLATGSVLSMDSAGVPSNVRYTKDGTPIRGARKPYVRTGGPIKPPPMPYAALTETYKGRPGSQFEVNQGAAGVSRKSAVSGSSFPSQLNSANVSSKSNKGKWKSSAWGKLKQGVEDFNQVSAQDPSLQGKLFQAALQSSQTSSSIGYEDYDLDFAAGQRDEDEGNNSDGSADSDEDMWRSRSLYKPSKKAVTKLGVWPRPPKQNYKLRYTWIPQPLLHNAVNNLYHEKTVWEYRKDAVENNPHDFKKEILQSKQRYQKKIEKSTMLSVVSDSHSSLRDSPIRRTNTSKSVSLANFGPNDAGVLSPTDGSMASSKYYKHFVRDGAQQGVGSPTPSIGFGAGGSERVGRGGSVMITALEEDDASSLDSGSLQDDLGGSFSPASSTQQLVKLGSQMSFSLRSKDGKSATYDAVSLGSRSPVSRSASPSGRTSPTPFNPPKSTYSHIPSARHSEAGAGDFDRSSRASSPGAFSAAGRASPGGSATSPWDSTAGAPTSSFYSAKVTSRSASKLIPSQQSEDAEFNHSLSRGTYLADAPRDLTSSEHAQALFVEKRSTTPSDLRANHYLPKQTRVTIKEPSEDDSHYFVPFAPVSTSPKAGGTSAKFKFKPTPSRNLAPPPTEESPQAKARSKSVSRSSFSASGPAEGSQKLLQTGAATGSTKRPPPPSGPPPDYVTSGSFKMSPSTKNIEDKKASPKAANNKKLSEKDTIHKYHFL